MRWRVAGALRPDADANDRQVIASLRLKENHLRAAAENAFTDALVTAALGKPRGGARLAVID
jgi:hypothetical protein